LVLLGFFSRRLSAALKHKDLKGFSNKTKEDKLNAVKLFYKKEDFNNFIKGKDLKFVADASDYKKNTQRKKNENAFPTQSITVAVADESTSSRKRSADQVSSLESTQKEAMYSCGNEICISTCGEDDGDDWTQCSHCGSLSSWYCPLKECQDTLNAHERVCKNQNKRKKLRAT
jgi:hypothetical protein